MKPKLIILDSAPAVVGEIASPPGFPGYPAFRVKAIFRKRCELWVSTTGPDSLSLLTYFDGCWSSQDYVFWQPELLSAKAIWLRVKVGNIPPPPKRKRS